MDFQKITENAFADVATDTIPELRQVSLDDFMDMTPEEKTQYIADEMAFINNVSNAIPRKKYIFTIDDSTGEIVSWREK